MIEKHAATLSAGRPGVLHGARSYLLQDADGQTLETHSISAGLDYPGVGPEHAWLHDSGRATYLPVTDEEAMAAFELLCRTEGIIPAIESAHALAGALRLGREAAEAGRTGQVILVNLSGRGDKDVATAARWFGLLDAPSDTDAPPYFPRHLKNVALLTPCFRSRSGTGTPLSASFRIPTIWVSLNFDFRMTTPDAEQST